jgi:hypothetical protein
MLKQWQSRQRRVSRSTVSQELNNSLDVSNCMLNTLWCLKYLRPGLHDSWNTAENALWPWVTQRGEGFWNLSRSRLHQGLIGWPRTRQRKQQGRENHELCGLQVRRLLDRPAWLKAGLNLSIGAVKCHAGDKGLQKDSDRALGIARRNSLRVRLQERWSYS